MTPSTTFTVSPMRCPVGRKDIPQNNEQSCCNAPVKISIPGHSHTGRGNIHTITRSVEPFTRIKCRRRQLNDPQQKSGCGNGQVIRTNTTMFPNYRPKKTWKCSTYTSSGHNGTRDEGLSVKDNVIDPGPERSKYVHKSIDQGAKAFRVEDLEEKIRCLAITFEDEPMRAVSSDIEEAYMKGQPLTPPEIEFSEDPEMEDNYWAWDQDTQRFRHWDGDLGEWVCFPERFD